MVAAVTAKPASVPSTVRAAVAQPLTRPAVIATARALPPARPATSVTAGGLDRAMLLELAEITGQLAALVENENEAIRGGKPGPVLEGNRERKALLIQNQERLVKAMREFPDDMAKADASIKAALKQAFQRFQTAIERHKLLAQAAIEVTQNLLRVIGKAATEQNNPITNYSRSAAVNRMPGAHGLRVAPVAVYRTA
ncbi:MAG: hypothetical protein FJX46_10970 [Alphaproteobacteria bacterium]|nr:hypothetical protein [Alphaproteobacteria bacterium]